MAVRCRVLAGRYLARSVCGHYSVPHKYFTYSFLRHYSSSSTGVEKKYEIDPGDFPQENIRNFCIVAHVDHGKSTLSDRLLEFTGTIKKSAENRQVLDKLPVERERGITVKAQSASMIYDHEGTSYLLNLIDTPGHVDFSYEVLRSVAVCQGVILLVDANQGIQAQTVANFNMAFCSELTIIPVLNKVDLKNADVEGVSDQMNNLFGTQKEEILKVSAKLGTGIEELIKSIIERIPPPKGDVSAPFRGFLLDSWYDRYRGVIALVIAADGELHPGDEIISHTSATSYIVRDLGFMHPDETPTPKLCAGQTGYVVANMRSPREAHVGDTLSHKSPDIKPLPKFEQSKPMVFAGVYPEDQSQNTELRSAIERLLLNDPSVQVSLESSPALGQGWRLGFLGLLHMDVFCQRLDQEFNAQVVVTAPSVCYKVKIVGAKNIKQYGGEMVTINNPLLLPDPCIVKEYYEPMATGTIISPDKYLSDIMSLCMNRRGQSKSTQNIDNRTIMLQYKFPLNEIIVDFFDELKSVTSGYASFDYEETGYELSSLVKMSILINGKEVDELTSIVHSTRARIVGRSMLLRLKEAIPQQLYAVALQAAIGGKVIAREDIKAIKKNVLAKCYGGDVTRKMKLLKRHSEKQKTLRLIGNIEIPRDAFIKVLKRS
ncbi:translation factor GUF1 homolog, mitochondrial-like [Ornithodoros turicata]|uniref:translation factor GUF1 homolog, mitochondrial-like n=1 Tax=Ornithodoros turicata TaxID=34597 RepID=UPI0031386AF0